MANATVKGAYMVEAGLPAKDMDLAFALLRIDDVFSKYDKEKNTLLDKHELRRALDRLWLPATAEQIEFLLSHATSSKGLDINKFERFTMGMEASYRKLFRTLDTNRNGAISKKELIDGMQDLQFRVSPKELDRLWPEFQGLANPRSGCYTSQKDPGRDEISYIQWRQALMYLPEARRWSDDMFRSSVLSTDLNGESIRRPRVQDDPMMLDLAAGCVAGCVSRTMTAPGEKVKTELQLLPAGKTVSAREVMRRVYAQGGVRAFFAGNAINCLKVAPQSGLFFALTDYFKRALPSPPSLISLHSFAAGTLAGLCSQFLVYPFEPIKTALTVARPGQYKGFLDCVRQLTAKEGNRALYKGLIPTLAGCIPYAGIQRVSYDWLKKKYFLFDRSSSASVSVNFGIGLLSSCLGMTASYPLMVVRTKLQMQGTPGHPRNFDGTWDCLCQVARAEGTRGLFRGIVPNLLKSAPAAALSFALYDKTKELLQMQFP